MYSKLLIWSTINTKSAIYPLEMADFPGSSASHQTDSEDSHTFTARGISELSLEGEVRTDCSMSLSLWKMSGISMEIYCCLPKPCLLLSCHNVASAFFKASGEGGTDPTGEWLYRALGREELPCSSAKKGNWAKSSRPCSGRTPETPGDP